MLPKIITSSVVRSSHQGESHGGVYLVDLEAGECQQVIDWNDPGIDWEGRGSDRGLRGIAVHQENVYLAASDEIFVYDREFRLIESFRNRYLKHCHEICSSGDKLYLTSTGLNSILEFDLLRRRWVCGYQIQRTLGWRGAVRRMWKGRRFGVKQWDLESDAGPASTPRSSDLHLNNVSPGPSSLFVAGTRIPFLLHLESETISEFAPLPLGTHNAARLGDGLIYNDTVNGRVTLATRANVPELSFGVPLYDTSELTHTDLPRDHARQGFARGLVLAGDLVIAGSSPSTISVYGIEEKRLLKSVRISRDIRNCIHGLTVWPF